MLSIDPCEAGHNETEGNVHVGVMLRGKRTKIDRNVGVDICLPATFS